MWSDCLINQNIRDTQTAMWLMFQVIKRLAGNEIILLLVNNFQALDMFV